MGRVGHASCACSIPGADAIPSDKSSPATCFIAFSFRCVTATSKFFAIALISLCQSVIRDGRPPIDSGLRNCDPARWTTAVCRPCSAAGGRAPALEFLARLRSGRIDAEDRAALRHLLLHEILEHRLLARLLRHLFGD